MTRLVKLSLKNFKSFKRADIPISSGFTAIVGGNGSGKSNILDALLFVLGITSLKTLRAGKLTDLVNTDAKENYSKVDLVLKDKGRQYEISRMVDKQGKSVYRLDGKRTTLNEISSLITELGIDIDGHNIVTQGDITRIIEMSPVERREVIENIAGLSEFDAKKDEAIGELDKVDSRIKEATIILNERTTFLEELEEEMKAAEEYRNLEEERKKTKATIIAKEILAVEKKIMAADNEIAELEKQKEIVNLRIEETRNSLAQTKSSVDAVTKKMLKASEQTYLTIGRDYEGKKSKLLLIQEKTELKRDQIAKNNEKIEVNNSSTKEAQGEKSKLNIQLNELTAQISKLSRELEEASKKKAELETELKSKNLVLQKEETALDDAIKTLEEFKKNSFELEVAAKNFEKHKSINEKRLEELASEEDSARKELQKIIEKKRELSEHQSASPHKRLEELEKKLFEVSEERSTYASKRANEEKAAGELRKAISQCPTCDSELKTDKKEALLRQKEAAIVHYNSKEKELAQNLAQIKKSIEEQREKVTVMARLAAETAQEKHLEDKLRHFSDKIRLIKEELSSLNAGNLAEKRRKNSEETQRLANEITQTRAKLQAARKSDAFGRYSELNTSLEELMKSKNNILEKSSQIRARLDSITLREEDASIENTALGGEIRQLEKEIKALEAQGEELAAEVAEKEKELGEAKKKNQVLGEEKEALDKKIEKMEREIAGEGAKLRKIEGRISEFNIEKGKLGVRESDLSEEQKTFTGIEPFASKTLEECKERLTGIEKRLSEIGAVNLKAVDNFNELKKEVEDIQGKANRLSEERLAVLDMIDKIEVKRTNVFMECFNEINKNFQDMFFKFFNGEGNLSFSDQEKPLDSGLIIDAKQKGGRLQNMDSMSGGEKTLTALAFMFAIQLYRPAPFYAFDEADAALDKENSFKMSNLIERIAEMSQFIAITHNDVITKKAHQIIGVARGKDGSSVIGLRLKNSKDEDLSAAMTNNNSNTEEIEEAS